MQTVTKDQAQNSIDTEQKPVFIYVGAAWCNPCKVYGPIFEAFSQAQAENAVFLKMDADEELDFMMRNGVRGVPTTMVFKNKTEINRRVGVMSEEDLTKLIAAVNE